MEAGCNARNKAEDGRSKVWRCPLDTFFAFCFCSSFLSLGNVVCAAFRDDPSQGAREWGNVLGLERSTVVRACSRASRSEIRRSGLWMLLQCFDAIFPAD